MHTLESNFFAMTKAFVDYKCKETRIKCNSAGIRSRHYYKNIYFDYATLSNRLFSMRKRKYGYLSMFREKVSSPLSISNINF